VRAWAAAVFSHSPYRAREFALQQQIPLFDSDLDTLLARSEIRYVYVCNHPRHHGQTVLAALRAGKHVLCEPPLALNLEEAHYLHNAAANRGLTLAANYQHRQDPSLEVLRKLVAEHDLGTVIGGYIRNCVLLPPALQTWRVEPAWGGILFDRTLRTVDLLRFLLQGEIASVQARSGLRMFSGEEPAGEDLERASTIEDAHCIVTMKPGGATFHLHDSYLLPHAPSRIDLFGASGSVTIMPWSETGASAMSIYRHGERLQVHTPQTSSWQRTILAFESSVATGRAIAPGSAEDIENLSVCIAIRDAILQGIAIQPTQQSMFLQ
jgi:1,5-anhydro-D-fructose reductase (1,5-anhydro-D-mannitol-forming)